MGRTRRLRSAQSWRDLLHVLVSFVLSTVSFSIAVTWVATGPGGLTYWFWSRFLPEDNRGLPALLGYSGRFIDVSFNTVVGLLFLVSTPLVLAGMVRLHAAVARGLLVDPNAALRRRVSDLTLSRSAAGEAEVHTLRRLERDLHDGPQQRLVRLDMDISAAQRRMATDPHQASRLLDEAFRQSQDALAEIRTLSRGIAPPILTERGLEAAVTAVAARGSVSTSVDALGRAQPPGEGPAGLMAEGRSNAAIAAGLVVSAGAVEKHISNIFAKINLPDLGLDNRRVLAVLAWLKAR